MKYWIIINNTQQGPLTLDEIRSIPEVTSETPVWHPGLPTWTTIAYVPELAAIIAPPIPVFAPEVTPKPNIPYRLRQPQATPPEPASYLIWNILTTILCCFIPGAIGIYFSAKVSSKYAQGDFYGARKMSERAQWMIIISIVCGLISLPFQLLIAML